MATSAERVSPLGIIKKAPEEDTLVFATLAGLSSVNPIPEFWDAVAGTGSPVKRLAEFVQAAILLAGFSQ